MQQSCTKDDIRRLWLYYDNTVQMRFMAALTKLCPCVKYTFNHIAGSKQL